MGAIASNSSKNITDGAELLALSNTFLTAYSLSPTYFVNSYGPFTVMKLTFASFAIPFASMVLPQPGGPYNSTPPPLISKFNFLNFSLCLIGRMISLMRASLMCYSAPISLSFVVGILANPDLLRTGMTSLLAWTKSSKMSSLSDSILTTILFTHLFKAYCRKLTKSTAT